MFLARFKNLLLRSAHAFLITALTALSFGPTLTALAANTTYYVDCLNGNDANNGTSTSTPWRTLGKVNGITFGAGDKILFKRGVTCSGMLNPKGSGTSSTAYITLDAYSTGTRPIISGGANPAAIKLYNQQYWRIQNIETTGGNPFGIWIGGNTGTLNHFRITGVSAHDVGGTATSKDNGLIMVGPDWGSSAVFNDVIIDGATAYNTGEWNGIRIACKGSNGAASNASPVIIRNSTAHDVGGDGIVIFTCSNGTIENTVAYQTGKITTAAYGTPNSTWTWSCNNCTVQFNEAYTAHSPGVDGGAYDIDWGDNNNTVQYNYGHDVDSYCVSVFGADLSSTNAVVRYNICSNNGLDPTESVKGDYFLTTWNGGLINGVKIYNNTSYWNVNQPLFANWASLTGTNFFKNNILYTTGWIFTDIRNATMPLNNNLYWSSAAGATANNIWWSWNNTWYLGFAAYKSGSGQDGSSQYADPKLNSPTYHGVGKPTTQFTLQAGSPAINAGANVGSMGSRDFFSNTIPQGGAYDIGAHESGGAPSPTATPAPGPNLVTNPGLEANGATQTPTGWSEWSSAGHVDASYTETGAPHSGTYKATHWKGVAYDVYTYQTKTGLTNGLYTLKAWVMSGGGQSIARMEAKDFGGTQLNSTLPITSTWTQITIANINVTNGQCTFGFYSVANAGNWINFDDVEFYKQ